MVYTHTYGRRARYWSGGEVYPVQDWQGIIHVRCVCIGQGCLQKVLPEPGGRYPASPIGPTSQGPPGSTTSLFWVVVTIGTSGTSEPWVVVDDVTPNTVAPISTPIAEPITTHPSVYAVNVTCSFKLGIFDYRSLMLYLRRLALKHLRQ